MKTDAGKSPTSNNQNAADRPTQNEGLSAAPPSYGIGAVDRLTKKENRTGLPDNLKAGIEQLSGLSMDDVRVHYNSSKPAPLGALAYTQGTEIHVGPGQEKQLPHEAWHVVQQKQRRVRPTVKFGRSIISSTQSLEDEADLISSKVLSHHHTKLAFHHYGSTLSLNNNLTNETPQSQTCDTSQTAHISTTELSAPLEYSATGLPNAGVIQCAKKKKKKEGKYDRATGTYNHRPKAPKDFYRDLSVPLKVPTQKAHKYPLSWITNAINDALNLGPIKLDEAMKILESVAKFSAKPFTFPPTFKTELGSPIGRRSTGFGDTINTLASNAGWTEWNIRRTPIPEHRDDDPGNSGLDLNYTSSGHTTPRSHEIERINIAGGISAVDPSELETRLKQLVDKENKPVIANDILPYDASAWQITTSGKYEDKNNPENWQGPFAEITHPDNMENIKADNYLIRMKCNSKTNNVEIKIQKEGTLGGWVAARQDTHKPTEIWWYDWRNIDYGKYEIMSRAWSIDRKEFVSRHIQVER